MRTIVVGSLNTDLVATGIKQFPGVGEHVYGTSLKIGPGGKSRNIADMIARLSPPDSVAMVGRTVKDKYGFWEVPLEALNKAGVNTDYVIVGDDKSGQELPGIALIPVDKQGNNQIFVLPGASNDFSIEDINSSAPLFEAVAKQDGVIVVTLECPIATAEESVRLANKHDLKVFFDPGGITTELNLDKLIGAGVFLIKPNEHEAKVLTGVDVVDSASAQRAAQILFSYGVENVLITLGSEGAYLFTSDGEGQIPIPPLETAEESDETGCGDQTMAALCALVQEGLSLSKAAPQAVLAGTMQFGRSGIQPVTKAELQQAMGKQ